MSQLFKKLIYNKFPKQTEQVVVIEYLYNNNVYKTSVGVYDDKEKAYKVALIQALILLRDFYIISKRTLDVLNSRSSIEWKYNVLQEEYKSLFDETKHTKVYVESYNVSSTTLFFIKKYHLRNPNPDASMHSFKKLIVKYNRFYYKSKVNFAFNDNDNGDVNVFKK